MEGGVREWREGGGGEGSDAGGVSEGEMMDEGIRRGLGRE